MMTTGERYQKMVKNHKDSSPLFPLSEVAAEAEKAHIMRILKSTKGNKTKAAEILGISRKTLWEKVKAYHIE
jgi:two-component system response regulator AtoC